MRLTPFDRATAENLCATIDEHVTIRFVAVLGDQRADPHIIGYTILTRDTAESDRERYGDRIRADACGAIAPVIADAYQNQGIGTQMARHVMGCASKMGLQQVILMGGVLASNARAIRFYEKLGFQRAGEFWTDEARKRLCYDMILGFLDDATV